MEQATTAIIEQDIQLAYEGKISFPETVKNLLEVGVERYYTDLIAHQKTYYAQGGAVHFLRLPKSKMPQDAGPFSKEGIVAALRAIQRSEIDYPEFLRRIIRAGTVGYSAFLLGKQVHYFGAKGEIYIENFPTSKD